MTGLCWSCSEGGTANLPRELQNSIERNGSLSFLRTVASRDGFRFFCQMTQHFADLACRLGSAEKVPLRLRAAFALEVVQLFSRLDSFACRRHAEAASEPGDRANDGHGILVRSE